MFTTKASSDLYNMGSLQNMFGSGPNIRANFFRPPPAASNDNKKLLSFVALEEKKHVFVGLLLNSTRVSFLEATERGRG